MKQKETAVIDIYVYDSKAISLEARCSGPRKFLEEHFLAMREEAIWFEEFEELDCEGSLMFWYLVPEHEDTFRIVRFV
jgi:hypothetical protein